MKSFLSISFVLFASFFSKAQNLVASYPFNGAANDATGNIANNGTVNGATLVADRFGNANSAYYFDGVNNFIEANADNLPTGNNTISVWFKADVGSMANRPGIFGYGGNTGGCPGNSQIMILNLSGGNNFTTQAHCLNNYASYAYTSAPENKWYNWVVSTNETTIKMYLNGELISTDNTNTRPKIVAGKKMCIGAVVGPAGNSNYTDPNVGHFKGVIDDVKIYDWYLTDRQIADKFAEESVVAFYPFNGNANDQSGNDNHGTVVGALLTNDRFGNTDAAYDFSVTDKIDVPDSPSFQIGTNDYTLQYWIKTVADNVVVMGKAPHTLLGMMQYIYPGGTIEGRSEYPIGIFGSDIAINNNVWHQVVYVRKGTLAKIFIDGRLSNSATVPLSDISNTDNFSIGHNGPDPFSGQLDDVKIYNAAFTDNQVFDNYIKDQTLPGSGDALLLNGTNYLEVPNHDNFNFGNSFTASSWIKTTSFNADIFSNFEEAFPFSGTLLGVGFGSNGNNSDARAGKLGFYIGNGNGNISESYNDLSGPRVDDNKWHHVAVTYNGSEVKFYVDGINTSTLAANGNLIGNSIKALRIGRDNNEPGVRYFNGSIDELQLWNQTLTIQEIRDWMCKKITSAHPQYDKLKAYFNFDEKVQSIAQARKSATVLNPKVRGFGGHFGELINGAILQTSGAAIGDASDHDYINTIKSALISHTTGESFLVKSITGDPAGIQVYRVDEAPSNLTGHIGLDPFPTYYGVFQAGGTSPTYNGTYTYFGNQIPGGVEANLRLYSRENNATASWTEKPALPNTSNKTISLTGQSTEYILGSALTTLPLDLLSFTGKSESNQNILNWQTANEVALSHFEIERSDNANNFEKIGTVKANGGPSEKVIYEYIDSQNSSLTSDNSILFYRLKMMDLNGKFKYSKIINIENKQQAELTIYPNPSSDYFSISGNQSFEKLQILDASGRIVKEFLPQNDNKYSLKGLSEGVYLVRNIGSNGLTNSKLIIK